MLERVDTIIKVRMNICTGGTTARCKHLRGIFALGATARRRRQPRPPPPSTPPCTSGSRPSGRCSPVGGFLSERKFANDNCQAYLPWKLFSGDNFELTPPSARQASLALARSSQSAALGVASTTGAS